MNAPMGAAQLASASLQNYILVEERARAAGSAPELLFTIANETWQVFQYRQGVVWRLRDDRAVLRIVSGLAQLTEDSPFTVWLRRLGQVLARRIVRDPEFIVVGDLPDALADGWREWMPEYLLVYPVLGPNGRRMGLAAYALEEAPSDAQQALALRLMGAYGHAWAALEPARRGPRMPAARKWGWGLALLALAAMLIPVRLSVLAPAEVIALEARTISSPMDGVIKQFHVQPNQPVSASQLLFTLDETTLRNRREVVAKQLQVARADAMAAQQKSFDNESSRADLASLNGKVAERQAELAYVNDLLERVEVRSPADGVVVFGDVNDWQGKPVVTGERVALLADPRDAGVLIWLPVSDAINLETGTEVRLYLQVAPLAPMTARLSQTSYQAMLSPDGISAYRLRARFDGLTPEQFALARIGLKGTAKILGQRASLGYYLFRRPLSTLRELSGF